MDEVGTIFTDQRHLERMRGQAQGFSFLPRQPVRSLLSGRHASRIRGRGLDFEELRHYRIGDDVRSIDWRVTVRTGKPHVRVYTEERERPVLVLVDQRRNMFFGSQVRMKSVVAAEVSALAAWRVVDVTDRVGGIVFNEREISMIRPERSRHTVRRFLGEVSRFTQMLAEQQPSDEPPSQTLASVLARAEQVCNHDHLVILISDFDGWDEGCLRRLQRITRHNNLIAGLVFDPLERELPEASSMVVSDGGARQLEVSAAKGRLARAFTESFQSSVDTIEAELRKFGVPVLPLQTVDPAAAQIRQSLGKLEALR